MILTATVFSALSLIAPPPTLVAAGDIGVCGSQADEATAALVARMPGTVAVLGDAVYPRGTAEEFRDCYSWARFRARTRAALGNHEYASGDASAAIDYFGLPPHGYYSYRLGTWHVVVLNSNCRPAGGCEHGSPQQRWLEAELERVGARCTLAYMHHPRFTSGLHGSDATIAPLWQTLVRAGADVALAGHDHHYERFAPIGGIRSFVVGTGGATLRPVFRRLQRPRSLAMTARTHGVLQLKLRPGRYEWTFVPNAQSSFSDAGLGRCS